MVKAKRMGVVYFKVWVLSINNCCLGLIWGRQKDMNSWLDGSFHAKLK